MADRLTRDLGCHGQCNNKKALHRAMVQYLIKNHHSSLYHQLVWHPFHCQFLAPLPSCCFLLHLFRFYICFLMFLTTHSRLGHHDNLGCWETMNASFLFTKSLGVLLMLHCQACDVACAGRQLRFEEEEVPAVWPLACQATLTTYTALKHL